MNVHNIFTSHENIRSEVSEKISYIRFYNATTKNVYILWFDFKGKLVLYKTLSPREFVNITTYETHPWGCCDTERFTRLNMNGKPTYYPVPWVPEENAELGVADGTRTIPLRRDNIVITSPLPSLLDRSAEVVCDNLKDISDVCQLDIPHSLMGELCQKFLSLIKGKMITARCHYQIRNVNHLS